MAKYIRIHPEDNVAVALTDLDKGQRLPEFNDLILVENIPSGHKFTLQDLKEGDKIIKYGFPIGHLTTDAPKGSLVDHNCIKTNLSGVLSYTYNPKLKDIEPAKRAITFKGYRRADAQVGIRNQIWIIPTVGCVNGTAQAIAERLRIEKSGIMGSVDAIVAFPHNYGCSQLGEDHENTRKILADMAHHPNAGGVLFVSLGCENNQLSSFRDLISDCDPLRVRAIECQKIEGDETEEGLKQAREMFDICSKDKRTDVPISELKVGLKCGGSDGLSGITANPLLGVFSDWLVSQGGTTVLTEVPEMFGAETILMNRCQDIVTFNKTVSLINDFKEYFIHNNQPVYENPSPGNKAGGISTLEEKSLGCTQKCGTSIVRDVLKYGERLKTKGLNLLSSPGNDLVASTALAAAGCQIVLFTTGRGTPFGSFVPTMKISTNTSLSVRKKRWIDFNAGVIAEDEPIQETSQRFIEKIIESISGKPVKNEENGIREIAIFKTGVTL